MRVLYAEAVYDDEEISAVLNVLKNNPHQLMSGENVREFEQQVAKSPDSGVKTKEANSLFMMSTPRRHISRS